MCMFMAVNVGDDVRRRMKQERWTLTWSSGTMLVKAFKITQSRLKNSQFLGISRPVGSSLLTLCCEASNFVF